MSKAVMQQALEALEVMWRHFSSARLGEYTATDYATRNAAYAAIYQLRVVLAEPEQEPVAWVELTDEEQLELARGSMGRSRHWLVAQVEAKLKEKNT